MLVREIEKKLDMRLILKLREDTDFFDSTKDLGFKLPVYIFGRNSKMWMETYFPKNDRNSKIELILKRFGAIEKEESFVVESEINNVKDLDIISKLTSAPSFVINSSDMSDGYLNVDARFHSSQLKEVSDHLAQFAADSKNSRISWLGPSEGLMRLMDQISSDYPLSLVSYRVPIDKGEPLLNDFLSYPDVLVEMRNNLNHEDKISAILYSMNRISAELENLYEISAKDGVYQVDVSNKFHNIVRNAANKRHIRRTRYFVRPSKGFLEMNVLLPSSGVYEYYSLLYELERDQIKGLVIRNIMPYSNLVWEFI